VPAFEFLRCLPARHEAALKALSNLLKVPAGRGHRACRGRERGLLLAGCSWSAPLPTEEQLHRLPRHADQRDAGDRGPHRAEQRQAFRL